MAHLLVTGGAGYIGCHTLRALTRAGHSAVVLDDLRAGNPSFVADAPLVRADVSDRTAVDRAFSECGPFDGVLHCASLISANESTARPLAYYLNNAAGSAALIDVCLAHDVRVFVLSSTAAVYGEPEHQPIAESTPLEPINPYGAAKAMVERMLADAQTAHGLRWAALRYFNAAGADLEGDLGECHDPETHLIPVALEAASGLRDRFELFGSDYATPDGTCIRDYIHVTDLASAHVLATEALLEGRTLGPHNLGTGRGRSNREVLAAVERAVGKPVPVREAPRRPGDPPQLVADPRRFREEFAWRPRHSDLDTIVESAWAWLQRWKKR